MATVGRSALTPTVHQFFDALRSYDVAKALAAFAPDAVWETPWQGKLTGKPAIEAALKAWLGDAKGRPSLSMVDVSGDGAITHLKLSVSGRFGKAPERVVMSVLCLTGQIRQVKVQE